MTIQSVNRGKQLRLAREYRGLNQKDLCSKVYGLSQSNLSKFENGFEGMIGDDLLKEILMFLDFPFDFIDAVIPPVYTSWDL